MRAFLILTALGWAMSLPWATLFAYFVLIVGALVAAWFLAISIERHPAPPRQDRKVIDLNYVAALEAMVVAAETEIETLRTELQRLRSTAAASEPDPKAALFGRVGLSPGAPEWVVQAAPQIVPISAPSRSSSSASEKGGGEAFQGS
ncbi:MAG: hypothetical protein J0J10_20095 [Bosea sp.]|uniref:hypothetical protein n=1 Tax=Bosea sp. (in: a-proteobacteria) TaxID=1871050 RepID=UPI001AD2AB71|nr:hypothetical protein [Bosea sp. (in: a-proteobacteria)]MBN9471074.1 hypothetical protein [Bosea sp. (in: a-proteobacteria)]